MSSKKRKQQLRKAQRKRNLKLMYSRELYLKMKVLFSKILPQIPKDIKLNFLESLSPEEQAFMKQEEEFVQNKIESGK